ncbi:hypothetical protein [Streptomyces sp. NPDC017958]|uniref:hypothetical protein n=1 Tax=Streptomyces sp. NPDC017958 TaxID=3365021 RepID=UPI0037A2F949
MARSSDPLLSLPPGLIAPQVHAELLTRARTLPPEHLRLLMEHTREPFAQAILDGRVTRMRKDRMLLTGDAAFAVRPHTAASAEKAAADAIHLFTTFQQLPSLDAALAAWERNRLAEGTALYRTASASDNGSVSTVPSRRRMPPSARPAEVRQATPQGRRRPRRGLATRYEKTTTVLRGGLTPPASSSGPPADPKEST